MIFASALILMSLLSSSPESQDQPLTISRLSQEVLNGDRKIEVGGAIPGRVMAHGERAIVVAAVREGSSLSPAIVASEFGKGRVAAFGHGALLAPVHPIKVLLTWISNGGGEVSLNRSIPQGFDSSGLRLSQIGQRKLSDLTAIVIGPSDIGSRFSEKELKEFVRNGGGLIVIDTPWGWLQLNPGKTLKSDHPGNRLLAEMGIGFADGYLDKVGGAVELVPPTKELHILKSLEIYKGTESVSPAAGANITQILTSALRDGRDELDCIQELRSLAKSRSTANFPISGKPIGATDFRTRIGIVSYDLEWRKLPPTKVTAHPSSLDFPGQVRDGESSVRTEQDVQPGVRRWRSTGQYAPAGALISVTLSESLRSNRISIRIGGHSDQLWSLDKWERMPSIDLEIPVVEGRATLANPFGGLIYLVSSDQLPSGTISIEGSIAAPTYFLGQTSAAEWKSVRGNGAPWGEIVGVQSAISVPARVLRNLDNPEDIARYFDEMVFEAEKFYAVDLRTTEHRFQVDRQISAGYMHAGYPIMTWEDVSERFVDISVLRGKSGGPNWGFYHELGHNYQEGSWTWDGWGETTNNLFSLFACAHFNQQLLGHGAMAQNEVEKRLEIVKSSPGAEAYYKKDPWFGLTFWDMMRREFGFEVFTKFFRWCKGKNLGNEQGKKDAFLIEMSRLTQRNLAPYGEMWGVRFSAVAKEQVKGYQVWIPDELM